MFNLSKALTVSVSQNRDVSAKKSVGGELYGSSSGGAYSTPTKAMVTKLNFRTMEMMYFANTWVRACVDKIVRRSVSVQPIVKAILKNPTGEPTDDQKRRIESIENLLSVPNSMQQSFDTIRKQLFTDSLIWDAAALELVKGEDGKSIDAMYAVSGDSITLNVDKRGVFKKFSEAYYQKEYGSVVAKFSVDELLYFIQYPRANSFYGLSPLESLRQTVTAELYAADFNIKRFINDATPRYAVLFDSLGLGQGGAAMKRIREWWDSELKGNPHKPILVGSEQGSVKFEKIGMSNEDMQFQEYSRWLLSKIMSVYHMQPAVLGVIDVNQGRINASYQEEQFKKDALRPILTSFSNQFNTLAIWSSTNYGWNDIYLDWDGIDVVDKEKEAKIHEVYLKQGVFTINMVLRELGKEEVPWGDVPYLLNQMVPIPSIPIAQARETLPATPVPQLKSFTNPNTEFSMADWMRMGYLLKYNKYPTGLETVEDTDLKKAITTLIGKRNKKLDKVVIYKK